jgi:hypothetical protein
MSKENKLPNPQYDEHGNRKDMVLGKNYDGSQSVLPGYVLVDGCWVHPSRAEDFRARNEKLNPKE